MAHGVSKLMLRKMHSCMLAETREANVSRAAINYIDD